MSKNDLEKIRLAVENILRIRGARGYSAGHPIKNREYRVPLGRSNYEIEDDAKDIPDPKNLVDVSRAFRKEKQ
tara:strand:- start:1543 stop:1761 length:219 start_codon:yes stop_codon:yes gene_type:complete